MGLLERMRSLIKANINEILRKAEDPEQTLDDLIRAMDEDLAEARAGVAAAVREERRLRDRCANHEREADQLVRSAELAVRKGEDDLAREALRRRRQHLALARTASEQWEAERRTLEELQGNLAILETKIEQARRQKEALLAQQRLARVRRELQENAGIRRSSATDRTLGRLTDDIDELEAESSAYAELAVRDVRTQVAHMDVIKAQDESDIESELEGLKQRMKKTP